MNISVVITTKNERNNISRLIKSLEKIKDDLHEVIVVDAGSDDGTIDEILKYDFVRLYCFPKSTRGAGRNLGISKATGDIIAFLDADTEICDGWIKELKTSFDLGFDIVAGYSSSPKGKQLPRVSIYVNGQDITYPACNIAYKKEIFDKIGGFDERLITAEDIELNYRAVRHGYVIYYNPKMKVWHYHKKTFMGFIKQSFWNGYGRLQLNYIHPDLKGKHLHGLNIKNGIRMIMGLFGYLYAGWHKIPIGMRFFIVMLLVLMIIFMPIFVYGG